MFFSNEIQSGLGPGVCCPKTIVQATSKMKNRCKQGYLDKAAPKKTCYNKVDGGGDCFDAQLSRKGSAGFRFAASQVLEKQKKRHENKKPNTRKKKHGEKQIKL